MTDRKTANKGEVRADEDKIGKWALPLLGLSLLIYGQVVGFGLIDGWDDHFYFVERELLDRWWVASWSERLLTPDVGYPSAIPTFFYVLFRGSVPALHGLALVMHLLNVVLVYLVGRCWLKSQGAALAVGLLWAAHPVLAESVAWITNLKSLGAATCVLLVLLVWRRHLDDPRGKWLWAVVGLLVLSLGFKPVGGVILPLVLGLTLVFRPRILVRPPTLIFAAVSGLITLGYLRVANEMHRAFIVETAGFEPVHVDGAQWLARIGAAFFVQLRNLVYPLQLHPMYFETEITAGAVTAGWAAIFLLLAYTGWTWWKCREATAGMVLFWLSYLPSSGIEYMPRFTADTYAYLPLFGLLWSIAAIVESRQAVKEEARGRILRFTVVAVTVAFGLMAALQAARWESSETLWPPVLLDNQEVYVPYHMVAQVHFNRGDYEEAAAYWREGIQYYADGGGDRIMGLGIALERSGRPEEALGHMIRILSGEFAEPDGAKAYTLYLLVAYELELPETSRERALVLEAARSRVGTDEMVGEAARQAEEYFVGQGEEEIARLFRQSRGD